MKRDYFIEVFIILHHVREDDSLEVMRSESWYVLNSEPMQAFTRNGIEVLKADVQIRMQYIGLLYIFVMRK